MKDFLENTAKTWSFNFLITLVFTIVGAIFCLLIIRFVASKKGKNKPISPKTDVSAVVEEAKRTFVSASRKNELKTKSKAFSLGVKVVLEGVTEEYFSGDSKKYAFFVNSEYLPDGIELPLEFGLFELLEFFDRFILALSRNVENVLDSKEFRLAYKTYRFINKKIEKNPRDLSISVVLEMFLEKNEEESKSLAKKFFGSVVLKPITKLGLKIAKPMLFEVVDKFALCALNDIADVANSLCVGELAPNNDATDAVNAFCAGELATAEEKLEGITDSAAEEQDTDNPETEEQITKTREAEEL